MSVFRKQKEQMLVGDPLPVWFTAFTELPVGDDTNMQPAFYPPSVAGDRSTTT